jgi:dTDP-4-amino-4,6-dideoxygalactose transaminase
MIPFNKPPVAGNEEKYVLEAIRNAKLSGDGPFTERCHRWFQTKLDCTKALLTPSCTHALEMAAILIDIQPGDEVIMPSYTFVSTANAFVLRGAKIVFVDIRPDTMNIDENLIEPAITEKTKAIVPVHYAGAGCEMDTVMNIAKRYNLFVIEDAAQGMMSRYKNRPLGTIGHIGTYSFHETKNYTSGGEGGLLIVNDERFSERAEIIREKGTNRSQFLRGMVDKYSWVDVGSSYLPSELQAAYLWGQLESAEDINNTRLHLWNLYLSHFKPLAEEGDIALPVSNRYCSHNAHIFYIKTENLKIRTKLINHLKEDGIQSAFHYIPLHTSHAGKKFGRFSGEDLFTSRESDRLVRLPLFYGLQRDEQQRIIDSLYSFYGRNKKSRIEHHDD